MKIESHDGLASSQASWSFTMSQTGSRYGMDGSAIALQDFRGNVDPEVGHDYSNDVHEAQKLLPVWGYPLGALWFVHDLEEFQEREVSDSGTHCELYALIPDEFLQLSRKFS